MLRVAGDIERCPPGPNFRTRRDAPANFCNLSDLCKMPLTASSLIEVKRAPGKGRGVFARQFIAAGTVFERVPLLVIPAREIPDDPNASLLWSYIFEYGRGTVALALGFGSLYNHSYEPNARYDDAGMQIKEFTALRDIHAGEEITINYNGAEDVRDPVYFDVV